MMPCRLAALAFGAVAVLSGAATASLPDGDCAGVYWDWTARFDSGDRVEARLVWTARGPGASVAAAQGIWTDADGVETPFQNGRRFGRFETREGGRWIRIGSTRQTLARLPGEAARFSVDNDKRGVKLSLDVPRSSSPGTPLRLGVAGLEIRALHVGGATRARLWRRGMPSPRSVSGHSTLLETRHGPCEDSLVRWRVDVVTADAAWIHLVPTRGAPRTGRISSEADDLEPSPRWTASPFEGDHPNEAPRLPARLRTPGGTIRFGEILRVSRPIDALPLPLRWLYGWGHQPTRVWCAARFDSVDPGDRDALASFTLLEAWTGSQNAESGG